MSSAKYYQFDSENSTKLGAAHTSPTRCNAGLGPFRIVPHSGESRSGVFNFRSESMLEDRQVRPASNQTRVETGAEPEWNLTKAMETCGYRFSLSVTGRLTNRCLGDTAVMDVRRDSRMPSLNAKEEPAMVDTLARCPWAMEHGRHTGQPVPELQHSIPCSELA